MLISIIAWWLALQVISFICLPLTTLLFRNLPLSGYSFNKTAGLLLTGYLGWLLSMLGVGSFSFSTIMFAVLMIGFVSLWISRWPVVASSLRGLGSKWLAILFFEIFFVLMLYAGLWLRWHGATGSAILGTEKPMELAFLSGILRSPTFPPQDPWLAGYAINYYYLGYLLVATLAAVSGVAVGEAFNLGLATIFALTASMVAGILIAMIFYSRKPETRGDWAKVLIALSLGIIFVLVMGNQAGAFQILFGSPKAVTLGDRQFANALSQRLLGAETIFIRPPIQTSPNDFDLISEIDPDSAATFNWWWPSRVVWDTVAVKPDVVEKQYAITEFPFFSFFLGDLHPHVLALPFDLLALALAFAALTASAPPSFSGNNEERLRLAFTGITLGSIYFINSWDAPTYIGLYIGALLLAYRRHFNSQQENFPYQKITRALARLIPACVIPLIPFILTFQSFAGNRSIPAQLSWMPLINIVGKILSPTPNHTTLYAFFSIFGIHFIVILFYALRSDILSYDAWRGNKKTSIFNWLALICVLLLGIGVGFPLLALFLLVAFLARKVWILTEKDPVASFFLWTVSVAALVILAADMAYIRDPFENRMNTVFKLYYQAWLILGVMAVYAVWAISQYKLGRIWFWAVSALLLFGGLIYPIKALTVGEKWFPTEQELNGLAFLQSQSPDEYATLLWVEQNTSPDSIILTSVGSSYDDSSGRIASATGRPTLLGWSGSHERLWRSGSPEALTAIAQREQDIPYIYKSTDWDSVRQLLKSYRVDYVFIGYRERQLYGEPGLEKFNSHLHLVFEQGNVQIFRCQSQPDE